MRRTTPGRYAASLDSRPPFTTSTQLGATRSTTPTSSNTPSRRYVSPSTRQRQAQHTTTAAMMVPARFGGPHSRSLGEHGRASPPGGDETIGALLTDLVSLSHSIERYIVENPNAVAGPTPVPRSLRADEIERVVRRVEEHFKGKIEELERRIDEQKDVIVQLSRERDQWRRKASDASERASGAPQNTAEAVRGSIASRSVALNDIERAWAAEAEHSDPQGATPKSIREHGELQQLRQILLEEKRQRLLVEEQTQSLTEQHSKVVNTLEQRIRKQEKQLQLIMDAFEQHQSGLQQPTAAGSGALFSDDGVRGTPRSIKFRQRSTRHGGDEYYGAAHAPLPPSALNHHNPPTPEVHSGQSSSRLSGFSKLAATGAFTDRADSADITDVIELSHGNAVRSSNPPVASGGPTVPKLPLDTSAGLLAAGAGTGSAAARLSTAEVNRNEPNLLPEAAMDDVAAFLANISKELESISDVEGQRQSRLAALS